MKFAFEVVIRRLSAGALVFFFALQAQAVPFDFDVSYNGGSIALDAGSDDPIGQALSAGDTFNYNLQTVGDDFWKVDVGGSFFPFLAFTVDGSETREGTFMLDLLLDGISQFSTGPGAISNAFVHLGTNAIDLSAGLMFDEIILDYALTSSTGPTTIVDYVIGGSVPGGFDDGISYNRTPSNPAPVPATLALFGLGLAALRLGRLRPTSG